MSKVVFFIVPTENHINPTLPIVAELVRRGEQVTYYGTEAFRTMIEGTGASFRLYEGDFTFQDEPDSPIALSIDLIRQTRDLLPSLLAQLRHEPPDLIIHDTMSAWGWTVAQVLGVPAIASAALILFNSTILMRTGKMYSLMRSTLASMSLIQQYREITGELEQAYQVRFPGVLDILNLTGQLTLSYTTEQFQPFASAFGSGMRFVGPSIAPRRQPAPDIREKINADARLIYVDSQALHQQNPTLFNAVFTALAGMPVQVVITGELPLEASPLSATAHVIALPESAHDEILQRAALFIGSGDMLSTHEALYKDVPLLVLPTNTMQSIIGGQVVAHQAGLMLENGDVNPVHIRERVNEMLNTSIFAQNAAILGESMRNAGGYLHAVDEILAFQRKQSSLSAG